ncbi:uncharacterized protein N7484_011696 [Penicillium longicatenatum]|uniref:uncharacterized protein n=1 Tax=Penicillium longicatenatum TaxID=1561947 RepID=UPI002546FEC7|nr:uncharacterized protein N7484_011696 [Penicillium longicatenatum]KAJ5631596.1 hypothetical protein N7484_011696 [Penicillium longicatenatum]
MALMNIKDAQRLADDIGGGWKTNTDPTERRRIQNRLNQRAYKLRKRQIRQRELIESSPRVQLCDTGFGMLVPSSAADARPVQHSFDLPLTVDHLLSLIHFNVWRALLTNSGSMRLSHVFSTCPSAKGYFTPSLFPSEIPPSLRPTSLQLSVPHEPSIDFFPLPRLRDNLILMGSNLFTMGSFCRDMLGTLFQNHGIDNSDRKGLIVWGDPWDVNSWECTPGFLMEWGWLLEGCDELLYSTNRWRISRGEEPILAQVGASLSASYREKQTIVVGPVS